MASNYFKWLGEKFKTVGTTDGGHSIQVSLNDGNGTPILADLSGGIPVITEFQSAVHNGESFCYSANQIGLTNTSTVVLLGRTGAKQVHFDGFSVRASQAPFRIQFYEAPTVSNAGTILTSRRRNRSNANTSLMAIYQTPTYSASGILLDDDLIVETSQGNNQNSGGGSVDDGWVLKANTDYLIVMTNLSGATINWSAKFTWHEATYNV